MHFTQAVQIEEFIGTFYKTADIDIYSLTKTFSLLYECWKLNCDWLTNLFCFLAFFSAALMMKHRTTLVIFILVQILNIVLCVRRLVLIWTFCEIIYWIMKIRKNRSAVHLKENPEKKGKIVYFFSFKYWDLLPYTKYVENVIHAV